jgi:hypothetical protein
LDNTISGDVEQYKQEEQRYLRATELQYTKERQNMQAVQQAANA